MDITLDQLPLRPELVGQQPYGAPQLGDLIQLNVNENPYPLPSKVHLQLVAALSASIRDLNRYPDREAEKLRTGLAKYLGFGLTKDNIWAANGSNEIMQHILTAFGGPGRTLLSFTPTYSMYPEYARNTFTNYVTAPRSRNYTLDAEEILVASVQTKANIILLCSPNNPTGTRIPITVIDDVCAYTDAMVIVDEAYQEFTDYPEDSALSLLPKYPRLIVTRTMSKAFALAGARVGYLAAAKAIVDACRIVRLPYHLSVQTQTVANVALANANLMLKQVDNLHQQCQDLQDWLADQGLDVIPSQANFCLFGRFQDRHQVWQDLVDEGILIRETGPSGYLRVSVGTPKETAAFKAALTKVLPRTRRLS